LNIEDVEAVKKENQAESLVLRSFLKKKVIFLLA
jgi:hypothetical protein